MFLVGSINFLGVAHMSIYDFQVKKSDGSEQSLKDYEGKVLLIVNTASRCGFTPQYEGLQQLQEEFKDQGFSVLAFPCNQFGNQEPGSNSEIQQFCKINYDVSFPVFAKVDVNGANADPLFQYLKKGAPGVLNTEPVKWNFTKFLVSKDGEVLKRFAPATTPTAIADEIAEALK